jgi:hypothetical protein
MVRSRLYGRVLGLVCLLSLLGAVPGRATDVDLMAFMMSTPGQWNRFSYNVPAGYPPFTVTVTRLTSGLFAGKLRIGDYRTPDPSKFQWMIMDWDATKMYLYASSSGTYNPPIALPRFVPLNILQPHPFEPGMSWYFKIFPSQKVPAGTFTDALAWITLDQQYKPNAVNSQLGLQGVPYAVTAVDWYVRQAGDLASQDVDAASGKINFSYQLAAYGLPNTASVLDLLLE